MARTGRRRGAPTWVCESDCKKGEQRQQAHGPIAEVQQPESEQKDIAYAAFAISACEKGEQKQQAHGLDAGKQQDYEVQAISHKASAISAGANGEQRQQALGQLGSFAAS